MAGTTKLEAVNTMLSAIGEAPVNTITGGQTGDVAMAENILNEITRVVLVEGWNFNMDIEVELTRNSDDEILAPADGLAVRPYNKRQHNFAVRGGKIYDLEKRTYTWTTNVKANIVRDIAYEDLPEPVRQYIMHRAARIFRMRVLNDLQDRVPSEEEIRALADMKLHESEEADYRLSDAYDISRITYRQSPRDMHSQ
jgi:hypothetical protein